MPVWGRSTDLPARAVCSIFAAIMKHAHHFIIGRAAILAAASLFFCTAAQAQEKRFTHNVTGLLKARMEADTEAGNFRFGVANARLGINGRTTGTGKTGFRYAFQVDLNAEGKLSILDSYAAFWAGPIEVSIGQQQYRFGTELNRGPRNNFFADNSFLTSYLTSYYHTDAAAGKSRYGSYGSRDIGLMLKYTATEYLPVDIFLGAMNGTGINNPVWDRHINFVARVSVDDGRIFNGFGIALNYYNGHSPYGDAISMAGAELRYMKGRWRAEGEYAERRLSVDGGVDPLRVAVAHLIYCQPLHDCGVLRFVAPMARYDYGDNLAVLVDEGAGKSRIDHFSAQRATVGVTLGFAERLLQCELRLNYEHVFGDLPAAAASNPALHNRFVLEFYLGF